MSKVWYRTGGKKYAETEPPYYDSKDFPWMAEMTGNWREMKNEIAGLIEENDNKFQSNSYLGISAPGGWTSLSYMFWGLKIRKDLEKECPLLNGYLQKIPGLVSMSFSCLAPKISLTEHYGDTNTVLRCHFGIEIPAGLPDCGLKVNGESKAWQEGGWIVFNDAYLHSAWNLTEKRRIVMIMDVVRPEFLRKENRICVYIRARHTQFQIQKKYGFINKLPKFLKDLLFTGLYVSIYIMKPVRALMGR